MHNEANYDKQLNNYRDEERIEPLPLKVESNGPKEILRDWFRLTYGYVQNEIRKKIFEAKTKVYTKYDNMPYFSFQRIMAGVKRRWGRLPKGVRRSKPQNDINLKETLHQAPKYIQLGRKTRKKLVY